MIHCKHILIASLTIATTLWQGLYAQNNTTDLDRTVKAVSNETCLRHASLAVNVYDITTHKNIYAHNAQMSLIPASMSKLFTTAIAFDQLGGDFRFKTTLCHDGTIDANGALDGNVYITGGGDPLLGSYRYRQTTPDSVFRTWTAAIRAAGIKKINGRICYNQSIYDRATLHSSWQWGDIGNYYGAGTCGLNFHENMYFAYFNAGNRLGAPTLLDHIGPTNINVRNINEVATGPEGSGDNVVIYGDPTSQQRVYRGTIPAGARNFAIRGAMPNPATACAELFATFLRQQGINVSLNVKEVFSTPTDVQPILDYYSSPYHVLAQYINRTSNNMYAESLFKYLGYSRFDKGSYTTGSKVLKAFFKSHALETGGVDIVDGSGLSRNNHVTCDFTCRFLNEISKMIIYDDLIKTMSQAGVNGTSRNMLTNLPQGIKVYIKSGTMSGIKCYCGYVIDANKHQRCFCLMVNNHECDASISKSLEKILYQIAVLK